MGELVLILEDDPGRLARFERVVEREFSKLRVVSWLSARRMIQEVGGYMDDAAVISLDHALYGADGEDLGDGVEVTRFLATQKPRCPVIIHSSNADRSAVMRGTLELEGWSVRMVMPFGVGWVEEYWVKVVKELVGE